MAKSKAKLKVQKLAEGYGLTIISRNYKKGVWLKVEFAKRYFPEIYAALTTSKYVDCEITIKIPPSPPANKARLVIKE